MPLGLIGFWVYGLEFSLFCLRLVDIMVGVALEGAGILKPRGIALFLLFLAFILWPFQGPATASWKADSKKAVCYCKNDFTLVNICLRAEVLHV